MILKEDNRGHDSPELILTFAPGVVRYLDPIDLVGERGLSVNEEIRSYEHPPSIEFPDRSYTPYTFKMPDSLGSAVEGCFQYGNFPCLYEVKPYEDILVDLTKIFSVYVKQPFISNAYWLFHRYLEADQLVLDQFLESWVRDATSYNVVKSYLGSTEHVCLGAGLGCGSNYVFKKTNYVLNRRKDIEVAEKKVLLEETKKESAVRDQRYTDAIMRSSYDIFTYLMEDTRNGLIKIGKSKNPERREKTLQSEAPSVELRIAVPTESDFEQELHRIFAHLRRRGEYFELSKSQTKEVIEQLLANGDASRTITCEEWLGNVFLGAFLEKNQCDI